MKHRLTQRPGPDGVLQRAGWRLQGSRAAAAPWPGAPRIAPHALRLKHQPLQRDLHPQIDPQIIGKADINARAIALIVKVRVRSVIARRGHPQPLPRQDVGEDADR